MGFIKGKVKDFYLLTTDVENICICLQRRAIT